MKAETRFCFYFTETMKSSSFKTVCSWVLEESRTDSSSVRCFLKLCSHCLHMAINTFLSKDSRVLVYKKNNVLTGKTKPKRVLFPSSQKHKRCHDAPILGYSRGRGKFHLSWVKTLGQLWAIVPASRWQCQPSGKSPTDTWRSHHPPWDLSAATRTVRCI